MQPHTMCYWTLRKLQAHTADLMRPTRAVLVSGIRLCDIEEGVFGAVHTECRQPKVALHTQMLMGSHG